MWQQWLFNMLLRLLEKATPEIRERLIGFLDKWEADAKATPNPIDDYLVMIVRGLLSL